MASRPKLRELDATIEVLGGESVFFDLMLEHGTLNKVAEALGVNRLLLHWWIKRTPEREKAFKDIRELIGSNMLDELEELSNEMPEIMPLTGGVDSGWVSNHKLRIDTKKWLAARYNAALSDRPAPGTVTPEAVNTLAELFATIKQARSQRLVGGEQHVIEGEVVSDVAPVYSKPLMGDA